MIHSLTASLPVAEGKEKEKEYTTDPELIDEQFSKIVNITIDGGIGGTEPSTIVNCTSGEPEIVRQGKGILVE